LPGAFSVVKDSVYVENVIAAESMMFHEYPDVLSVTQLCKALNIGYSTALSILQDGKLHSLKVGRAYKIPKFSLVEYLRGT
jgi:excisionase family DNA binding protein